MRLFYAICFNSFIKKSILEHIWELKENSKTGNFTDPDNLHLTLAFIGETNKPDKAIEAAKCINVPSFSITLDKPGFFRNGKTQIRWIGIEKNIQLENLHIQLVNSLKNCGLFIDNRRFLPHITVGRQVIMRSKPILYTQKPKMKVNKISLMRSDKKEGRLIYTKIYEKELNC